MLRGTIFNPEVPGRGLDHRPYHEKKKKNNKDSDGIGMHPLTADYGSLSDSSNPIIKANRFILFITITLT